jgi:hypothetical protein
MGKTNKPDRRDKPDKPESVGGLRMEVETNQKNQINPEKGRGPSPSGLYGQTNQTNETNQIN